MTTPAPAGAPALNATAPASAIPATTGTPYGITHIEQLVDVAVQAVNNYKAITPTDTTFGKVSRFIPTLMSAVSALDSISKSGPEFKDLDAAEVKQLADKYLPQLGLGSGKTAVYVEEGVNIVVSVFKIFKAQ